MSATPDEEGRKDLVSRVEEMGEAETEAFLFRTDVIVLEALLGAMIHRWGMQKTVEVLHDELADLEVHG